MNRSKATVQPVNDKAGLIQQLVAEIGSNQKIILKKEPRIRTTEGRPRKYYFSEKTSEEEANMSGLASLFVDSDRPTVPKSSSAQKSMPEHDLYPLLSQYLGAEFSVYSKRIDEKRSKNKRGAGSNHWLFPDLVGLEDLSSDWLPLVNDCAGEYGSQKARLWSFEVKLLLNMSNVRECFFQAVSNSSWANFSYLVAGQITGRDTMQELQMLCALHGVGLLRLDADSPTESEHLIPAKETDIDWHSANRLAQANSDFSDVLELITDFHKTDKIHPGQWDAPAIETD